MKKLLTILTGILLGANMAFGLVTEHTNQVDLVLSNTCDGTFNDFKLSIPGYNDEKFVFRYDVDLTGVDCVFRITKPIEGTIYLDVAVSDISVTTTTVTWNIARTNIPPPGNYYGELLSYQTGTSNFYRSLAQGKLPITWSLYLNETNYFQRSTTNAAVGQIYVHPSWVYPTWSSTNSTIALSNYVVLIDGNLQTNINVLSNHVSATYAKQVDYAATSNDLDTAETDISNLKTSTQTLNTALGNLQTATNALNSNKLNLSGGTMTGPMTNTVGYYGYGIGITGLVGYATGTPIYVESEPLHTNWVATNTYIKTNTGNWAGTWQTFGTNEFANKVETANSTNALNTRAGNLETATNALNTRMTSAETSTNNLNTRLSVTETNALLLIGTRAMQGNLNMGNNSITNVASNSFIFTDGQALTSTKIQLYDTLDDSTNALNTRAGNLETATNALNSAMIRGASLAAGTSDSVTTNAGGMLALTWNTNAAAGAAAFPLTANGDLAGFSLTNGSFVGNGAGLTNVNATNATSLGGVVAANYLLANTDSGAANFEWGTNNTTIQGNAFAVGWNNSIAGGASRGIMVGTYGQVSHNNSIVINADANNGSVLASTNDHQLVLGAKNGILMVGKVTANGAGITNIPFSGLQLTSSPSFHADMTTQTVTNDVYTKMQCGSEAWDITSAYDTSLYRFTPVVLGRYILTCSLFFNPALADKRFFMDIYQNGASIRSGTRFTISGSVGITEQLSTIINVTNAADYYEFWIKQEAGTTNDVGTYNSYFEGSILQ